MRPLVAAEFGELANHLGAADETVETEGLAEQDKDAESPHEPRPMQESDRLMRLASLCSDELQVDQWQLEHQLFRSDELEYRMSRLETVVAIQRAKMYVLLGLLTPLGKP